MTLGDSTMKVCDRCGANGSGESCTICGASNWRTEQATRVAPDVTARGTTSGDWKSTFGKPSTLGARFAARLIDLGIVIVGLMILGWLLGQLGSSLFGNLIGLIGVFVLFGGYEFIMILKYGQTVGKKAMDLRVVRVDGSQLGAGSAAIRAFVPVGISLFTLGLGGLLFVLSPLFDSNSGWNRGWYDTMASTLVVSA